MKATKSLQKRIVLVFAVLAAVFLCTGTVLSFITMRTFQKEVEKRNLTLAKSINHFLEENLEHRAYELWKMSKDIDRMGLMDPRVQELMEDCVDSHRVFRNIQLVKENGIVLRTAPSLPGIIGNDISSLPYFSEVYPRGDEISWSGVYRCDLCNTVTVTMSVLTGEGARIIGHLDLERLSQMIRKDYPFSDGFLAVTDEAGEVVAHTIKGVNVGDLHLAALFPVVREFEGMKDSFEATVRGEKGLVSTQQLALNGWSVLIFEPLRGAFEAVNRVRNAAFTVLGVTLLVSLALLLMVVNRIMGPVRRMVRQTRKVAKGDYGTTIDPKYAEFTEMAESFNAMARSIENREDELTRSKQHYQDLYNQNPVPIIIVNMADLTILDVNDSAVRVYGYSGEEFRGMNLARISHEEDLKDLTSTLCLSSKGKEEGIVKRNRKKDGTVIHVEIITHAISYKGKSARMIICKDITELRRSEERLKDSLAEKEMLLQEIHHRVKNNLQAISGIVELQRNYSPDLWTKKILQDTQNRILSMAIIHEKLYQVQEFNRINFRGYVHTLLDHLSSIYQVDERGITVEFTCDEFFLNVDTGLPCGLIITELVSNALKHAFIDKEDGKVRIRITRDERDRINICVGDNGVGLPGDFFELSNDSLGLNLVHSYVEFLSGEICVNNKVGTVFEMALEEYEECSYLGV